MSIPPESLLENAVYRIIIVTLEPETLGRPLDLLGHSVPRWMAESAGLYWAQRWPDDVVMLIEYEEMTYGAERASEGGLPKAP